MNTSSKLRRGNDKFLILATNILKWKQNHSGEQLIRFSSKYSQFGNKHHDGLWISFKREYLRKIPMFIKKNKIKKKLKLIWGILELR